MARRRKFSAAADIAAASVAARPTLRPEDVPIERAVSGRPAVWPIAVWIKWAAVATTRPTTAQVYHANRYEAVNERPFGGFVYTVWAAGIPGVWDAPDD